MLNQRNWTTELAEKSLASLITRQRLEAQEDFRRLLDSIATHENDTCDGLSAQDCLESIFETARMLDPRK